MPVTGTEVSDLNNSTSLGSQGVSPDSIPVTPTDGIDVAGGPFRALRASGAGNISVRTASGNSRVMAFLAGETRHVAVDRVFATNTTATGIEGIV